MLILLPEDADSDKTFTEDDQGNWHEIEPTAAELAEIEANNEFLDDLDKPSEYEPETNGWDQTDGFDPYDKEYDVP